MDSDFINKRITALRMKCDVSEYKMSLDLGHSNGYINRIASGRSLPSVPELLYICEYLGITPKDFFDEDLENPILLQQAYDLLKNLKEEEIKVIISFMQLLQNKR